MNFCVIQLVDVGLGAGGGGGEREVIFMCQGGGGTEGGEEYVPSVLGRREQWWVRSE